MASRKIIGAAALTAALATGGAVGATLGVPGVSGAQSSPTTTTTAPAASTDPGPGRGPRGFGGGVELDAAAKALGMSTADLRTALQGGKSLADVAKEKGVDKQKVVDALVAAATTRLDEAKASLPERMADLVDRTFDGGRGKGFGMGFRLGVDADTAAKALGITVEDLRTQLRDGKSIADVATAQKVDLQKVVDALVANAKSRLAAAVTAGKITQAEADERSADLTDRITEQVNRTGGFGHGRHGGRGGPDGASDDDASGGN